jgi:hypothetical protein
LECPRTTWEVLPVVCLPIWRNGEMVRCGVDTWRFTHMLVGKG